MFAIVSIAGFQEKVQKGSKLKVPSLSAKEGASVTFDAVHLIADGKDLQLGAPLLKGASIEAKVLSHGKDDTIRVFKMKRRKRYRRTQGHRQGYSMIEVTGISGGK